MHELDLPTDRPIEHERDMKCIHIIIIVSYSLSYF